MILHDGEEILIEHDGIIVCKTVKIVEQKYPGISERLNKAAGVALGHIAYPTSLAEAELMEKLGFHYVKEHAPEKLTEWGLERPLPQVEK